MARVERMENMKIATRMKREYCSALSLTVWIRVCGGEGWESMLAMLFFRTRCICFVSVLISITPMLAQL